MLNMTTIDLLPNVSVFSDQGSRSHQEDRYLVRKLHLPVKNGVGLLLAVMDGHFGSEVSVLVSEILEDTFSQNLIKRKGQVDLALEITFRDIIVRCQSFDQGSTLSVVYIPVSDSGFYTFAHVAHLGDSPVFAIDASGNLMFTAEHNVRQNAHDTELIARQNKRMIDSGDLLISPNAITLDVRFLQLTRSVGDSTFNKVLIREPEYQQVPINKGSMLIIASDGIFVDEDHLKLYQTLLEKGGKGQDASDIGRWALDQGADDNITVIVWKP